MVLTGIPTSSEAQTAFTHRDDFEVLFRAEDRMVDDTNSVSAAQFRIFLNQAVRVVDAKLRPNRKLDTITTTAGTAVYDLNSDCYEQGVIWARTTIDDLGRLKAIKKIDGDDVGLTLTEETTYPQYFEEVGGTITFNPTPQGSWTVILAYEGRSDLFGQADADSADTIVTIPQEYDQLILDYVLVLAKKRMHLYSEASLIKNDWKQDLAESRALITPRPAAIVAPEKERGSP